MKKCQICGAEVDTGFVVHRDCLDALKKWQTAHIVKNTCFRNCRQKTSACVKLLRAKPKKLIFFAVA